MLLWDGEMDLKGYIELLPAYNHAVWRSRLVWFDDNFWWHLVGSIAEVEDGVDEVCAG